MENTRVGISLVSPPPPGIELTDASMAARSQNLSSARAAESGPSQPSEASAASASAARTGGPPTLWGEGCYHPYPGQLP